MKHLIALLIVACILALVFLVFPSASELINPGADASTSPGTKADAAAVIPEYYVSSIEFLGDRIVFTVEPASDFPAYSE
jgi:hypothetical protein